MRPIRNIWMLEEIGLPYTHVVCKPWSRVAKSVHPLGKVPALLVEYNKIRGANISDNNEEGREKFVLLESAAINTFLGDVAREIQHASLVPPPATRIRARYDSLVLFVMTELDAQSLWIHRKHNDLSNVFGEAPTAVQEARRQFDKALDVMIAQIDNNDEDEGSMMYLLQTGFSAVDIIFANCCFWAQQMNLLEWKPSSGGESTVATTTAAATTTSNGTSTPKKLLDPKLASYLKRIRCRPAFVKANELRKNQVYEKKERRNSKL